MEIFSFIAFIVIFGLIIWVNIVLTKTGNLDFTFTVGDKEKHQIRVTSNTLKTINIYVDGYRKINDFRFINSSTTYTLVVGETEKHTLKFIVDIPFFLGSFGSKKCTVLCDNKAIVNSISSQKSNK